MTVVEHKKKAVFLDRDGVLCEDTDYITRLDKMHIFTFAREAVKKIQEKGYLAIVVTNQSAVARGMMTEQRLVELNAFLKKETGVDAVYYCPHLPPDKREIQPYRVLCTCRKPRDGMLRRAAREYAVDLKSSYMVGDRESDIQAGKNAGTKTVYLSEDLGLTCGADAVYRTVLAFAQSEYLHTVC